MNNTPVLDQIKALFKRKRVLSTRQIAAALGKNPGDLSSLLHYHARVGNLVLVKKGTTGRDAVSPTWRLA